MFLQHFLNEFKFFLVSIDLSKTVNILVVASKFSKQFTGYCINFFIFWKKKC